MIVLYQPMLSLIWVLAAVLIGLAGSRRKFRFIGHFLVALLLSPLVGVIVLMATSPRPREAQK